MNLVLTLEDGGNTGRTRIPPAEIAAPECIYCHELCTLHARCASCEVLIHTEEYVCHCGKAHTLTKNGVDCTSCEDYKLNGLPPYPKDHFDGLAATLGF